MKKPSRSELLLEHADKLRSFRLPPEWSVAKLEVTYKRSGFLENYAEVIYDSMNHTFYVKTNKAIVYPNDFKALKEGVDIMQKANAIIGSKCIVENPKDTTSEPVIN